MSKQTERPRATAAKTAAPAPKRKKTQPSPPVQQPLVTSNVERIALAQSGYELIYPPEEKLPVIVVPNFPVLGKLTAVRFLEWVLQNPEGVVSLPTGKTPEHFIKWVHRFLSTWDAADTQRTLRDMGLESDRKPQLAGLRFVQIDEFYPIDTNQHNSFFYYVNKYYMRGFGLDPERAMFINPNEIGIPAGRTMTDVFPDMTMDISLRVRQARTHQDRVQQDVLKAVDEFCREYEERIRAMGGIGFFLGGIGPDGHIAFNVRGSDLFSTTRLTEANYETKAAAASDLGGIEVSRDKLVITIGHSTITHNPDCVALVIAAGEAKARIIARTIESDPSNQFPGSALSRLPNARFYLTHGAATRLRRRILADYEAKLELSQEDVCRIVMNLSIIHKKPFRDLTLADFHSNPCATTLLQKTEKPHTELAAQVEQIVLDRLRRGHEMIQDKTFLHTAPHHDDIILGYLPYFTFQLRSTTNNHYFTYLTSGFTAVTNRYMEAVVEDLLARLTKGDFQQLVDDDYFDATNRIARRVDTSLFLDGAARDLKEQQDEAVARRLMRNMIEIYEDDSVPNLIQRLRELKNYFETQYPGKKDIPIVQQLKGRMREFESDLKWAYYGFTGEAVRHLRLGFYKGDMFTEQPTVERDIPPVLDLLMEVKPDYVTVAFDPEGSGPDTHYKVLQAVSQALRIYEQKTGRHDVRVIGYRNVWFKFHPGEANLYVPTSLRDLNDMTAVFDTCFTTQRSASFPSPELDGPFSRLAQRIQVRQFEHLTTFLGEDYFLKSDDHGLRSTRAVVYLAEMSLQEFYEKSEQLRQVAEA